MKLSRRSFLGGILALTGTALVARAVPRPSVPIIYGDLIHDDAPGLNAMLNGESFEVAENVGATIIRLNGVEGGFVSNGTFLMRAPVLLTDRSAGFVIDECSFDFSEECDCALRIIEKDRPFATIRNSRFSRNPAAPPSVLARIMVSERTGGRWIGEGVEL